MQYIPYWSGLNLLGHSRVLRSSYFWLFAAPLLAYVLAKTGPSVHIPLWRSTLTISLGLPFSWKMFYYSSVAFAIASFLYSTQCPAVIRDYGGFPDFDAEGKGTRQLVLALFDSRGGLSSEDVAVRKAFINEFDTRGGVHHHQESMLNMMIPEPRLPAAFWWVREHADDTRQAYRVVCAVTYLLGSILIFIVVCQNFRYVWNSV